MAVHDLVQKAEPARPLLTQTPNARHLGGRMTNPTDNGTKKEPLLLELPVDFRLLGSQRPSEGATVCHVSGNLTLGAVSTCGGHVWRFCGTCPHRLSGDHVDTCFLRLQLPEISGG